MAEPRAVCSYLLSQGHHVYDVAVIYPVAPYEAEMGGDQARNTAPDFGQRLMAAGINFDFIDNDSLARAAVGFDAGGGLTEVAVTPVKTRPLVANAGRLRFVFADGPAGFNVYREIAVFGTSE